MISHPRCEEFEGELASILEDLIESLDDGWVVKVVDSKEWGHFAFSQEKPIVVFFRSGQPVLYDGKQELREPGLYAAWPGPANEEVMLEQLLQSMEPSVQDLTDNTFEHLTQVILKSLISVLHC